MWLSRVPKRNFSYSKWIEFSDYRKDHRLENQILNEKINKKSNTSLENTKVSVKDNEKRLKLFGIFAVIFSLGFIYDWCKPYAYKVRKADKRLKQLVFGTKKVYNKAIASVDKNFVTLSSEVEEEIGKYFRIIDSNYPKGIQSVSSQLCERIGIQPLEDFTLKTFFTSIRNSSLPLEQTLNNMKLFAMVNQRSPSS